MKRKILVLEDLASCRKALVDMVKGCREDLEVYDFGDSPNAFQCAIENEIDLFLIDIVLKPQQLNDFSGITFAQGIREISKYKAAEIVFITSLAGLESELLRTVHCFDYIEKPIFEERVQKVVNDALDKMDKKPRKDETVFLRKDRVTYPVRADKIICIESRRKTLYIRTVDDEIEIPNLSLKRLTQKIQTQEFLYTTKGIAININHIEYVDITNRFVKMREFKELISIGERMKDQFLTELYKYGNIERR